MPVWIVVTALCAGVASLAFSRAGRRHANQRTRITALTIAVGATLLALASGYAFVITMR